MERLDRLANANFWFTGTALAANGFLIDQAPFREMIFDGFTGAVINLCSTLLSAFAVFLLIDRAAFYEDWFKKERIEAKGTDDPQLIGDRAKARIDIVCKSMKRLFLCDYNSSSAFFVLMVLLSWVGVLWSNPYRSYLLTVTILVLLICGFGLYKGLSDRHWQTLKRVWRKIVAAVYLKRLFSDSESE